MTLEELLSVAEIVEKLTNRYRDQEAAHKAALTEIRASFNARTSADEKIIEGLREEIIRVNEAHGRTKVVHDGLLDELAVQRDAFTANVERIQCEGRDALRAEVAALQERLRASIARGDFAQMEVAALKSQTPKRHPVKVGEWVVRTAAGAQLAPIGTVAQVVSVADGLPDGYEYVIAGGRWHSDYCEPCVPPEATHDTAQGKAAAESGLLLNGGLDVRKVTT